MTTYDEAEIADRLDPREAAGWDDLRERARDDGVAWAATLPGSGR
ncbi:hypothetical protein [Jiangella sp. DSM 45060]|nr:hypothetical protein [Jiangella sp. DSM 45060]